MLFLLSSASTVWIAESYCRMLSRVRRQERQLELLMRELQHRGRNAIVVAQAIVTTSLRGNATVADAINRRLGALLLSNEQMLFAAQSRELRRLLEAELSPYHSGSIKLAGEPIMLAPGLAQALSLVFHELATNAAKYGALSTVNGSLDVSWLAIAGRACVRWVEQGGPPVTVPTRKGFGSLIQARVLNDFGGTILTDYRPEGLNCEISFDLIQPCSRSNFNELAPTLGRGAPP